MRAIIKILTILMLICMSAAHIFCSFLLVFAALLGGQPWILGLLIVAIFPPFVTIRKIWSHAWSDSDVVLIWLSIAPALFFSIQEATLPFTPNLPWLVPVIGAYTFTGISVFYLRFTEKDITALARHRQVEAGELPDGIEGAIDPLDPDAEIKKRANRGDLKGLFCPNGQAEQ